MGSTESWRISFLALHGETPKNAKAVVITPGGTGNLCFALLALLEFCAQGWAKAASSDAVQMHLLYTKFKQS